MKFSVMQVSVMSGQLGDIFWDLAPWIAYDPGYDLGCNIYVANPTDTAREYALMVRLSSGTTVVSEEVIPVFGYTWFKVDPGDFITLKGALRFTESNADLTVSLIERENGEATDTVATRLVATTSTSSLPPGWSVTPGNTGSSGTDWSSMMQMVFPIMMLGMVAAASKPREEKKEKTEAPASEKRLLPAGRGE
jgi:hypothetical protein